MNAPASLSWPTFLSFVTPRAATVGRQDDAVVARVRAQSARLCACSTAALRQHVDQLRRAWANADRPTSSPPLVAEAFALVNEAFRRTLNVEFYDVQLCAGRALVRGRIAEMATGEGKTFVQALAAFTYALAGNGVHVMTSNAYLAERDWAQLTPPLTQLGMRTGILKPTATPDDKRRTYQADITFGPGYEFGFDYLRDQLALSRTGDDRLGSSLHALLSGNDNQADTSIQRAHAVAIIDEIDSVLIDEATTPLVLSGAASQGNASTSAYMLAARVASNLAENKDYVLEISERRVQLTRGGVQRVLTTLRTDANIALERAWPVYVEQALFARHLLEKDVDYVVDEGKVLLVDQSTGRVFRDRTLRDGLHQAVEAKEHVPISQARSTLGRISRQQFFQLYDRKCGMTGTATGSEREFWQLYQLAITRIPTRKPCQRVVLPTRFFATKQQKRAALIQDVRRRAAAAQPVLVGTRTIEESQVLARALRTARIAVQVLNGVQDTAEADIIARAGTPGAVTVATNIAGRGTDIKLGPGVVEVGGLHVVASEPHESSRVDRQLTGRCARQGDPGSCQMFVSAQDELLVTHGPKLIRQITQSAGADGETSTDFSAALRRVQQRVEQLRFEHRRDMLDHDSWMEDVMAKLAEK